MTRQTVIKRVEKVMDLMKQGMDMTTAAKVAKTDSRTVRKIMKKLGVKRRKRGGRIYVITEYYKKLIDKMIYFMAGGWSASHACRHLHTTMATMKKMYVMVGGVRRPLLDSKDGRYTLNVYRIAGYPAVFFGRLVSYKHNIITGSTPRKLDVDDELTDDDYANILWQIDFDPFESTLMPEDVIAHYPQKVLAVIRKELLQSYPITGAKASGFLRNLTASKPGLVNNSLGTTKPSMMAADTTLTNLDMIFGMPKTDFDTDVECGIDERGITDRYVTPLEFERDKDVVNDGKFTIIVRRQSKSYAYPVIPLSIPFKHDLKKETSVPRQQSKRLYED